MKRKGISTIIASVLLILLVLVLAGVIYGFYRGFIPEQITMFGEPIKNSCERVVFDVDVYNTQNKTFLDAVNRGNVPINKFEIKKIEVGAIRGMGSFGDESLETGKTTTIEIGYVNVTDLNVGDEVVVVPILLGETSKGEEREFICDDEHGVNTGVIEL
jgi:flagellin-like protein